MHKVTCLSIGEITVPRLELIEADVLAHLIVNVKEALRDDIPNFDQITCFGDNTGVLFWIKIPREYKQFVRNRVNEILDLTTREMWRYCPSHCNPADIGSKGLLASKLKNNSLWLHGPPWLIQPEESWPVDISVDRLEASDEVMQEIKVTDRSTAL